MKRGDGGHSSQQPHFDPFKIFEQVFKGFKCGGGGFFNINLGGFGGDGGHGLFSQHPEDIETLTNEGKLKKLISESTSDTEAESKQFVAILYIESNGDCKKLKSSLVKIASSYKGAVNFYAVDCMSQPTLCRQVEPNVQRYPCIIYFGYKKRLPLGMEQVRKTISSR